MQYDKDSRCRPHPNTLLFERLPDSYTEPLLLEMLAPYGRLLTTKLISREDTKLASVTFETGLEARRALLALDGSVLCGRAIQASFDERGEMALYYKPSVTHIKLGQTFEHFNAPPKPPAVSETLPVLKSDLHSTVNGSGDGKPNVRIQTLCSTDQSDSLMSQLTGTS